MYCGPHGAPSWRREDAGRTRRPILGAVGDRARVLDAQRGPPVGTEPRERGRDLGQVQAVMRDPRGHEVETGEPPEARVVNEASQTLGLDRREERQTRRRRRALASTAAGSGGGAADPGMVSDLKRGAGRPSGEDGGKACAPRSHGWQRAIR